jgi:PST family polysaccharide transporter
MSYKKEFASGIFYTSIAKYSGLAISILLTSILARLLTPSDFGIIAIATVIMSFINLFTDFGFGPAIIQRKDLTIKDVNSIFTFTFFLGALAFIIIYLTSPFVANFYNMQELNKVLKILGLNAFFVAINIVPNAILLRNKQFKILALRTFGVQLFTGIIAVALAYKGFGVYALVAQSVSAAIIIFVYNYLVSNVKITKRIEFQSIIKISSYSFYQFLSSFITYFTRNLDKLILGKMMGITALGFYEKSYRLMTLPATNITYVIAPVMQPLLKDYQTDLNYIYNKYFSLLRILANIGFPLSVFLYYSAADLIELFYGPQWDGAVGTFKMPSFSVACLLLMGSTGPIYQSTNSVKLMSFMSLINGVITASCIILGVWLGSIETVAIMYTISTFISISWNFSVMHKKIFKKPMLTFLKVFKNPIIFASILAITYFVIDRILKSANIYVRLLSEGSLFGIIMLINFYRLGYIHKNLVKNLFSKVKK